MGERQTEDLKVAGSKPARDIFFLIKKIDVKFHGWAGIQKPGNCESLRLTRTRTNKMNALPEEVATFLNDRFATIRETCYHRDSYHSDYWRDATKMGQKMGSLLLKYPGLEDATILQILGALPHGGESRGLRLFLLDSNNGREILEHILQIHPTGHDIIVEGYRSYLYGRGYMGSILEDENIYLWEDQALKFLRTLLSGNYESEMEREAYIRCAYRMAQRLGVIPGEDAYEDMIHNLRSILRRIFGEEDIRSYTHAKFWAFYLIANPGRRTAETFQRREELSDSEDCFHILRIFRILNDQVFEEPAVANFNTAWGQFNEDDFEGYIV